jgi:bis(5'-nucleosidyl)-tetraphosphatase
MKNERSAGAVLFSRTADGNVSFLLLRHIDGHWSFPKGHTVLGEDEFDCAVREISEETGITRKQLEFEPGFERTIDYSYKRENETIHEETTYLLAALKESIAATLSKEHDEFVWAGLDQALGLLKFESLEWVLRSANKFIHDECQSPPHIIH